MNNLPIPLNDLHPIRLIHACNELLPCADATRLQNETRQKVRESKTHKRHQRRQNDPSENEHVILVSAHGPFHCRTDAVIEKQHDHGEDVKGFVITRHTWIFVMI